MGNVKQKKRKALLIGRQQAWEQLSTEAKKGTTKPGSLKR